MGSFTNQPDFATQATAITASDTMDSTTNLGKAALYVGTGGDVAVIVNGTKPLVANAVVFKNVSNGCWLPVICDYVIATGTSASDIVAVK
jgi:hypothetical protein